MMAKHLIHAVKMVFPSRRIIKRPEGRYLLAKHGEVGLANDEGEDEVDADSDRLSSASGFNVVELRGHQPAQRAPGPGKPSSEQALEGKNGTG